jgi:uncharacterized protein (DUF1501 family)
MTNDQPRDIDAITAIRCADCAASDSAAYDAVPVDYMPIPTEALAGFPDGVPQISRLNRGRFLRNGFLGFASVYAATKIPWQTAFESAIAEGAVAATNCVVMVYLNGGNDGPNTFVPADPTQYSAYLALRPTIARSNVPLPTVATPVGFQDMGGSASGQLAFPVLPGVTGATGSLQQLWDAGDVALFPATDYPNPNFSHFTSRDWWFAGLLQNSNTGWIGRWLDLYGSTTNPLQAVSIGSNVSKIIRAARAPVASVPENLAGFGFTVGGTNVNGEVGRVTPAPPGNASTARSRTVYGQTVQVAQSLATVSHIPGVNYPANSSLSRRLQLAATLLSANLGTRVITIDWGSFDTHGSQLGSQDPQLSVLGQALSAFQADLTSRGVVDRVTTLVFSEFGRRAGENASFGTDHGAGGPMMVVGSQVRGGLAGAPASMTGLVQGNLQVTTDFRSVYNAMLGEWLGGDPATVLPGAPSLVRADGGSLIL